MFETILETLPPAFGANITGTLTIAADATAVVGVGTDFVSDLTVGQVLSFVDGGGILRNIVITVITDTTNLTIAVAVTSIVTTKAFQVVTPASPFFIVDDPQNEGLPKNRIYNIATNPSLFASANGVLDFSFNNGVLIKSMYVRLPYQFTLADNNLVIRLETFTSSGQVVESITQFGTDGFLHLPIENIEVPLNTYIPVPADAVANSDIWHIRAKVQNSVGTDINETVSDHSQRLAAVSNISVPTVLTGQLLPVIIGMRVVHALQMIPLA